MVVEPTLDLRDLHEAKVKEDVEGDEDDVVVGKSVADENWDAAVFEHLESGLVERVLLQIFFTWRIDLVRDWKQGKFGIFDFDDQGSDCLKG